MNWYRVRKNYGVIPGSRTPTQEAKEPNSIFYVIELQLGRLDLGLVATLHLGLHLGLHLN